MSEKIILLIIKVYDWFAGVNVKELKVEEIKSESRRERI